MIYVNMHGQLGNQMFQYAFARSIQNKTNEKITISYYEVEKNGWEGNLDKFNLKECIIDSSSNFLISKTNLVQKIIGGLFFLKLRKYRNKDLRYKRISFQLKWQKFLNAIGLYWLDGGYYTVEKIKFRNKIINGQFEDPRYFQDIKEEIKSEYEYDEKLLSCENKIILNKINSSNSVCIAIRRGDFLDEENKKYFYICTLEYFKNAIKIIKEKVDNPVFFVFSNDIDWVKNNLVFGNEVYYENSKNTVLETFTLMKACKHFVISNSTFHWWAQYLSESSDKIVISPTKWSNLDFPSELIDESWIKIEV